ncbi:MAG: transferrin-binding protein-like solute binding protein [Paracoccaceae bacterium]
MKIISILGTVAAAAALTACSSGSGGTGGKVTGNTGADKVLATSNNSAAKELAEGTTLRASGRTSSAWVRDFTDGADTAVLAADSTVRIRRNELGGLDLITPNGTFQFTAADLTEDGYGFDTGTAGLWVWNGDSMADALNPDGEVRHNLVFNYYYDYNSSFSNNGFGVVGTETPDAALAALPTATYAGEARVQVAPAEGFTDWNTQVSSARGDLELTANFGAGEVSGSIGNLESRLPSGIDPSGTWTPFDGSLTLETAAIAGNGFSGAVTADAGFNANVGTLDASSRYSGTFFGPNAEEVAGGLSLSGTAADPEDPANPDYLGIGFIRGWQP